MLPPPDPKVFVITVKIIIYEITCHLPQKNQQNFVRYKREFVLTGIVITEFDCKSILSTEENNEKKSFLGQNINHLLHVELIQDVISSF